MLNSVIMKILTSKKLEVSKFGHLDTLNLDKSSTILTFQETKMSRFHDFKISRVQDFKNSRFLEFKIPRTQGFKNSRSQEFETSRIQYFKNHSLSRIQDLWMSRFQDFKVEATKNEHPDLNLDPVGVAPPTQQQRSELGGLTHQRSSTLHGGLTSLCSHTLIWAVGVIISYNLELMP